MTDVLEALEANSSVTKKLDNTHAIKLGPYTKPCRIEVRAFSDHHLGDKASSTAWLKLFYERDLVGESVGGGDPIALFVDYYIYLAARSGVSLRLDTSNRISTLKNFGFELTFTPA